jgi:hypothetical protein
MVPRSVRSMAISEAKQRQSSVGSPKISHLELFHASEGMLSRRLHFQSLAPTKTNYNLRLSLTLQDIQEQLMYL